MNPQDYRIKPEYRPFKDAKECFEEMQKHKPYGWVKDASQMYNITIIRDDGIIVNTSIGGVLYKFLPEAKDFWVSLNQIYERR